MDDAQRGMPATYVRRDEVMDVVALAAQCCVKVTATCVAPSYSLPWLRGELETTIQNAMEENMLWPRRVVVPAEKTKAKDAVLPVLNKRTLEDLQHDDPLLRAERALAQQPALKSGALAGATDSFAASGPAAAAKAKFLKKAKVLQVSAPLA